jgi:hypothetical protein
MGLDIDRKVTLTATFRTFDEAGAGHATRTPAKLCPVRLSALPLPMAPDKSVKTCQEFRQGWSRIMAAFAGFDRVLLVPQVTAAV